MTAGTEQQRFNLHHLVHLQPIYRLSFARLEGLARMVEPQHLPAQRWLCRRGEREESLIYLLSGTVALVDAERHICEVKAGTSQALQPLVSRSPRPISIITHSEVVILRISRNLLEVLRDGEDQMEVAEICHDDPKLENRLFFDLYYHYMDGTMALPSIPDLAIRVRRAVADPHKSGHDVARIIQFDPVISGRLIQIANSTLYQTHEPCRSCVDAVMRLGLDECRDLVTTLTMKQLFRTHSRLLARRMKALWQHTTRVAAISHVLAQRIPGLNADHALLAGLTHDIGTLAIIGHLGRHPQMIDSIETHELFDLIDQAIAGLRGQIGAMVLRQWGFDSALVASALEAENSDYHSEHGLGYVDVVVVAHHYSLLAVGEGNGLPPLDTLPAFRAIPFLQLGAGQGLATLKEAQRQIDTLYRLLR